LLIFGERDRAGMCRAYKEKDNHPNHKNKTAVMIHRGGLKHYQLNSD
jgi:hypothetical protein